MKEVRELVGELTVIVVGISALIVAYCRAWDVATFLLVLAIFIKLSNWKHQPTWEMNNYYGCHHREGKEDE